MRILVELIGYIVLFSLLWFGAMWVINIIKIKKQKKNGKSN